MEKETHDFMNVDSFSQLPFIRPSPLKEPKPTSIRLFGIEFANDSEPTTTAPNDDSTTTTNNGGGGGGGGGGEESGDDGNNRRFECHYCCRNFPTSQALGGHQNAHKRERQHAKRVHLHSARFTDPHVYYRISGGSAIAPPLSYHSWTTAGASSSTAANPRFYGTYSSTHHAPITGSPTGFWRIPPVQTSAAFSRDHDPLPMVGHGDQWLKKSTAIGQIGRSGIVKSSVQDHVSLDLHL